MHRITITFTPADKPLDGRHITMRGLHGVLFNLLKEVDPAGASWLHDHPAPKPFSMAPQFNPAGQLTGVRYTTFNQPTTDLLLQAWQYSHNQHQLLRLGRYQTFYVAQVDLTSGPTIHQLASLPAVRQICLHFLSPTSFKQGPRGLPLPLPMNVFSTPFRVWQNYLPTPLAEDWLAWCQKDLFITEHTIQTATASIAHQEPFTGFIGSVTFFAHNGTSEQLKIWHALAHLAAFGGVGHKTTMGMGVVELKYSS